MLEWWPSSMQTLREWSDLPSSLVIAASCYSLPFIVMFIVVGRPIERRERGESFPWPATFGGAPPSLKNTENGVPGGFFLTWNMHKIHFRPPPSCGSLQRSPGPLTPSASRSQDIQNGGVIGPCDNVFPGPAVALDGPGCRLSWHAICNQCCLQRSVWRKAALNAN